LCPKCGVDPLHVKEYVVALHVDKECPKCGSCYTTGTKGMSKMWLQEDDICDTPDTVGRRGTDCLLHLSKVQVRCK